MEEIKNESKKRYISRENLGQRRGEGET